MNQRVVRIIVSVVLTAALLVLAVVGFSFLAGLREEAPRKPPAVQARAVESKVIAIDTVSARIVAYGTLASTQPLVLFSEESGILLEGDVSFRPAARFRKGDVLFRIDDRRIRLDLNSAKSDFMNALAGVLPEIKIDFPERYTVWHNYFNSLSFDGPIADMPEATNQKVKLYLSRFNVYKLFFSVRNLEIRLEKHTIYAPFNGSVISADLRAGSTVRDGTRLGEIIRLDNMEVEVPVATQDMAWIDHNRPVRFTSSEIPGEWTGRITRIAKTIDRRTQTIPVYISIESNNADLLYEGVFLKAEIPGKRIPNACTVHQKALYNGNFAYIVEGGKLGLRELAIARREIDSVIVTGGLAHGDTLVTEVLQGVAPNMPAQALLDTAAEGSAQ